MTLPNVRRFKVQFEVAINDDDAELLIEDYGDPDEYKDDPSGATETAIENYIEGMDTEYMDVASTVKVNFVEE